MNNTANITQKSNSNIAKFYKFLKTKPELLRKIGGKDKQNKKTRSGENIVIEDSEFSHDDGDDNDDEYAMDIN